MNQLYRNGCVAFPPIFPSEDEAALVDRALFVESGQSLFHYMRFEHFKTLLETRCLRMKRLDLFEESDPHEGKFPAANATRSSSLTAGFLGPSGGPEIFSQRRDFIEGVGRQLRYVHCWFGWDQEDKRMWSNYGDGGRGVCIRTTYRRFEEARSPIPNFSFNFCGVTYLDEDEPVSELISFLVACRKRKQFSHEKEFRLIAQMGPHFPPLTDAGNSTPTHILVPVDLERLFEKVIVGPNAPDEVYQITETIANVAAGSRVVRRSLLDRF